MNIQYSEYDKEEMALLFKFLHTWNKNETKLKNWSPLTWHIFFKPQRPHRENGLKRNLKYLHFLLLCIYHFNSRLLGFFAHLNNEFFSMSFLNKIVLKYNQDLVRLFFIWHCQSWRLCLRIYKHHISSKKFLNIQQK
jgi:hypothetical protein